MNIESCDCNFKNTIKENQFLETAFRKIQY